MITEENSNKLIRLAIKQNLLLWHLSKSLLDIDKKINDSIKSTNLS